ncbi:MAG: hypothetical protein IPI33_05135 [Dehalococcoidia bacterium]|nr:hypothetical protein [Dehalococcoidia bacterium]
MRIGDFEEAVAREFSARRGDIAAELPKLSARLSEPGHGATAPAVELPDSVQISAEARAAQSLGVGPFRLPSFPSPAGLVEGFRAIDAANEPRAVAAAASRIVELVGRMAAAIADGPLPATGDPPALLAATLVREVLSVAGRPIPAGVLVRIAVIARQLLLAAPPDSAPGTLGSPSTSFERAAVAVLMAVAALADTGTAPAAAQRPAALPPALLAYAGAPAPRIAPRRKTRRRNERQETAEAPQDEDDLSGYRPDSRRA